MFAWTSVLELVVAAICATLIGAEREYNKKPAGMRTCAVVGLGAALFAEVSRYGNWVLPHLGVTDADGSRVAAQIVSGVGFLGAGLIFVHRDSVRGLTTAACIWLVAAIGMGAGAGLWPLAVAATLVYLLGITSLSWISRILPHTHRYRSSLIITYRHGSAILAKVMETIGNHSIAVRNLNLVQIDQDEGSGERRNKVHVELDSQGGTISELVQDLSSLDGVYQVVTDNKGAHQEAWEE